MSASRVLTAGLVLAVCACGSSIQPPVASKASPSATPSSSTAPAVMPFVGIDFLDRSHGWAVTLDEDGLKVDVARTSDGGATWSAPVKAANLYLGDTPTPRFGVRFANVNDGWLFRQGLFATTDGGATWTATSVNAFVYDVGIAGSSVWAVTDRGLYRSQVGASEWTAMPPAPVGVDGPFELIRVSEQLAFIVQQAQFDTRLFRTTDGGATWTDLAAPCRGYGMPVATLDGVHVWMVCGSQPGAGEQQKSAYTSSDGGAHWTRRSYNDGVNSSGSIPIIGYVHWVALTSPATGFMANDRGNIYRSTDGAKTWTESRLGYGTEAFFNGLQFVDASVGWFAGLVEGVTPDGAVGIYRTTDGGATWKLMGSMPGSVP